MSIIYRSELERPLTSDEVDGNFHDLDGRVATLESETGQVSYVFNQPEVNGGNTEDTSRQGAITKTVDGRTWTATVRRNALGYLLQVGPWAEQA